MSEREQSHDPIVEEVHRIREEIYAEHGNDLHAYFQHLREMEKRDRAAGVHYVDPPTRLRPSRPDAA
jgi:hypothetical protein